jgi:hypothetical protein
LHIEGSEKVPKSQKGGGNETSNKAITCNNKAMGRNNINTWTSSKTWQVVAWWWWTTTRQQWQCKDNAKWQQIAQGNNEQLQRNNEQLQGNDKQLGESMIKYTTKVAISNYGHIFTHKCKKVKPKPFRSLLNHHGAQYWVYNMLYTKFENL